MIELKELLAIVILISGAFGFLGGLIAHLATKNKMKVEKHVSSFNTIASRDNIQDFIDGTSLDELTESKNK